MSPAGSLRISPEKAGDQSLKTTDHPMWPHVLQILKALLVHGLGHIMPEHATAFWDSTKKATAVALGEVP